MQRKIFVIGDSYCHRRSIDSDWPVVLSSLLDAKLEGKGFPGQSFWHQRRWMLKNLDTVQSSDIILICHTDTARLPCTSDFSIFPKLLNMNTSDAVISLSNLREPSKSQSEHFEKLHQLIIDFYKSELFVIDFYEYAWRMWLSELTGLTKHAKVFHLAFNDLVLAELKKSNVHGKVVTPALYRLSNREKSSWTGNAPDSRRNHLSDENNIILANELFRLITNDVACVINLDKFQK